MGRHELLHVHLTPGLQPVLPRQPTGFSREGPGVFGGGGGVFCVGLVDYVGSVWLPAIFSPYRHRSESAKLAKICAQTLAICIVVVCCIAAITAAPVFHSAV
jgi:hypothetical protein